MRISNCECFPEARTASAITIATAATAANAADIRVRFNSVKASHVFRASPM